MASPKVVVIGAGSMFFGRQCIKKMVTSEALRGGTLALVDTDKGILEKMAALASMAVEASGAPISVEASADRREVLKGADFVVLTFADRGVYFRGVDTEIALKYGVRMCSSDTIGPGGIFRALRAIPEVLNCARDFEALCPDAWVINYINPTSVLGIVLMRHAPGLRTFALCDGHHEPHFRRRVLGEAGILGEGEEITPEIEKKLDLAVGGVNHCTFMVRFNYDGRDMLPVRRRKLAEKAAADDAAEVYSKRHFNNRYALALMDLYGACPTAIGHTKEYVPFWQGYTTAEPDLPPIMPFDTGLRMKRVEEFWGEVDAWLNGGKPMTEFIEKTPSDHASDIIESMWGDLRRPFYINSPNRGAVTNMADDAFLELRCDIDMHGPRPQPFGEMPRGLRALSEQVLDTHELTAEAGVRCDRDLLLRAMMTDPIVNSISDARAIIEDMFAVQRDALSDEWYR